MSRLSFIVVIMLSIVSIAIGLIVFVGASFIAVVCVADACPPPEITIPTFSIIMFFLGAIILIADIVAYKRYKKPLENQIGTAEPLKNNLTTKTLFILTLSLWALAVGCYYFGYMASISSSTIPLGIFIITFFLTLAGLITFLVALINFFKNKTNSNSKSLS